MLCTIHTNYLRWVDRKDAFQSSWTFNMSNAFNLLKTMSQIYEIKHHISVDVKALVDIVWSFSHGTFPPCITWSIVLQLVTISHHVIIRQPKKYTTTTTKIKTPKSFPQNPLLNLKWQKLVPKSPKTDILIINGWKIQFPFEIGAFFSGHSFGCFQNRGTPKWMVYIGKPY